MKKTILILSILVFITLASQAKINGIYYVVNNLGHRITCHITFFDEKYYYIELDNSLSSDVIETDILSFGSFSLKGNGLSLVDAVNGHKIQLEVFNEKRIKVIRGLPFLNSKTLFYESKEDPFISEQYKSDYFNKVKTSLSLQNELDKYKSIDKNNILHKELYSFAKYELKIEKGGNYKFSYVYKAISEDTWKYLNLYERIMLPSDVIIIISEGTWKRQGNVLYLYDLSLQYTFHVFIEENGLNCKFLPGVFRDNLFLGL